jgi:hypothetical protein
MAMESESENTMYNQIDMESRLGTQKNRDQKKEMMLIQNDSLIPSNHEQIHIPQTMSKSRSERQRKGKID